MSMRSARTAAVVQFGVAVACLLAAYLVDRNSWIEGAYFNRSVGARPYAAVFTGETWPQDALAGAGIILILTAAVTALIAQRNSLTTRTLRRAAAVLAVLSVAGLITAGIRAEATGFSGLTVVEKVEQAGFLYRLDEAGPFVTLPDVLAGASIALLLVATAAALASRHARSHASTSSAWPSGGNTG
jgi:hypothetical protein